MIKKITYLILTFVTVLTNPSFAQETALSRTFHESGKINVVIAIVVVIFIGLIIYLIKLDKKISKIEKESNH